MTGQNKRNIDCYVVYEMIIQDNIEYNKKITHIASIFAITSKLFIDLFCGCGVGVLLWLHPCTLSYKNKQKVNKHSNKHKQKQGGKQTKKAKNKKQKQKQKQNKTKDKQKHLNSKIANLEIIERTATVMYDECE